MNFDAFISTIFITKSIFYLLLRLYLVVHRLLRKLVVASICKMDISSAGKVMASVFWDAKGILFVDYLPKGQTINGEYNASLLR